MGPALPAVELVARLRRRDPGAFDELYRLHRESIWRFLRRLAGTDAAAEDLFQETWMAAARHAHGLEEETRLLPWLYTIARNRYRNALRLRAADARRASAGPEASGLAAAGPSPHAESETRDRARVVAAAFQRLPEAHREILLLAAVDGLDASAIAAILDLRPEAARKRLSRARAELSRLTGIAVSEKGQDP